MNCIYSPKTLKPMKRCLPFIVLMLLLASCDQVIFQEPQPRKVNPLKEIPIVLQGMYLDQDGDTLYVNKDSFSYDSDEFHYLDKVYLSDSSVLKKYKDHYFYNTPFLVDEEEFWVCYILYVDDDGSGFDLYAMDPGDVVKLAKLQEITSKIRDVGGDQNNYLFNPKKKDYKKIISDSVFSKMISFDRIGK